VAAAAAAPIITSTTTTTTTSSSSSSRSTRSIFRIAVNTSNLSSEFASCDCLHTRLIELNFIN
jgi:hypothetical protein